MVLNELPTQRLSQVRAAEWRHLHGEYLLPNMDPRKALYRRLAKQYHPDLATGSSEKLLHDRLMVEINDAFSKGDVEILEEINSMGLTYLVYRFYANNHVPSGCVNTPEDDYPCQAAKRPRSGFRNAVKGFFYSSHPYSWLFAMNAWNETGKIRKLFAILMSGIWTYAFYKVWILLSVLSAYLVSSGHPHESIYGLGIVVLRGILILIALPCVAPLFIFGICLSFLLSFVYLGTLLASNVLALFHPMLAYVPPLVVIPALCWLGWNSLGDD